MGFEGLEQGPRGSFNILAVDTTAEFLSLALASGGKVRVLHRRVGRPHDETLLGGVDRLLVRAGIAMGDLHAIAAASGPGRFTGIRIGMAYASVAAAQLKIPALAVSRLEALAFRTPGRLVCAAVPGYREEKYYQLFRRAGGRAAAALRPEGRPFWVDAAAWEKVRAELEGKGVMVVLEEPRAADLLGPAELCLRRKRVPKFEPLYLKPAGYERKGG